MGAISDAIDAITEELRDLSGQVAELEEGSVTPPPEPDPEPDPEPTPGELVIPETLPYPESGLKEGESFEFMISCIDDVERDGTVNHKCEPTASGKNHHATFAYIGHGMPYIYSEGIPGNHDHGWWVPGERERYRCAYCFLYDKHPAPFGNTDVIRREGEGILTHRATIVRPFDVGYGKVNDKYMDEGVRYYDGTIANEEGAELSQDAQAAALDDFDYDAYVSVGAQDIRVGLFRADGEIIDIRDFTRIEVEKMPDGSPAGWFEFISAKNAPDKGGFRVTVGFILAQNEKVQHVLYYDTMGDNGRIAVEVNGTKVGEG